jgi:CheY-like chemotaxis protein
VPDSTPLPFDAGELPPGLREEYLQGVRERLGLLSALIARLAEHGEDLAALDQLRRETHKIRGSAGSYGFAEATDIAGEIEDAAKEWLAHPTALADLRGTIAGELLRRLEASFPAEADAPAPTPAPPAASAPPPSTAEQVPEIVLVEDDPALLELLEYGLRSRGYRYVIHRNGGEALAALRALEVGDARPLILLDVDLPALDGYTLFETLQSERPGVFRAVFTTVHGGEDEQLRGLEGGALDYLVKPISLRVALEKIRRWVGR